MSCGRATAGWTEGTVGPVVDPAVGPPVDTGRAPLRYRTVQARFQEAASRELQCSLEGIHFAGKRVNCSQSRILCVACTYRLLLSGYTQKAPELEHWPHAGLQCTSVSSLKVGFLMSFTVPYHTDTDH